MEKLFKNASASEAGDYYQLSFDDDDEKEDDDAESVEGRYFLIQRQFEFPDDDSFYLESDDASFCGHFKVRAATLTREFLSIEFLAAEWTTLRIRFAADQDCYEELERIMRIMFEDKSLHWDQHLGRGSKPQI